MGICLKPGQSEIVTAETSLGIFGKEKLFFLDLVVGTAFHLQWLRVTLPSSQENLAEKEA